MHQNGYYIDIDDEFEAYGFFMELFDEDSFRLDNLLPWLEEHVKPLF